MNTVLLLVASNLFMTTAWYWHLKSHSLPLLGIIAISWLIALPEYCLAVPANRLGHIAFGGTYTAPQLKILQEGIALLVFLGFTLAVLKEVPRWTDIAGMGLIVAGLAVSLGARA
ncbi:MAG: DMT family protein [Planctomycetes bacterium]|nr:DMT family protein [Planctomycetota bacterium]